MLKAGDLFIAGRSGGVAGAFVPWRRGHAGVAPAHVFRYAGTDQLRIGGQKTKVAYVPPDADLAFFPVSACQPTELGKPRLGDAILVNALRTRGCRVTDVSWSIAYVMLQPRDLPGPGDSGTPLVQDGKVVGMLLNINLGTCKGVVISAEMVKREL
jgi:hypothetical protein